MYLSHGNDDPSHAPVHFSQPLDYAMPPTAGPPRRAPRRAGRGIAITIIAAITCIMLRNAVESPCARGAAVPAVTVLRPHRITIDTLVIKITTSVRDHFIKIFPVYKI